MIGCGQLNVLSSQTAGFFLSSVSPKGVNRYLCLIIVNLFFIYLFPNTVYEIWQDSI